MTDAVRALVGGLFDDAAQFPPARLALEDAIAAHRQARAGEWSWMIGRFLCPASRLGTAADLPRPLGVVADGEWRADLELALTAGAQAFELRDPGADSYEVLGAAPVEVYVEGAASPAALQAAGLGAKLRCGGLTAEAFPADATVAAFLGDCRALGLAFKLTAGLHQPYRTRHAEIGVLQHGFVNLLAATILDVDPETRTAIVAEKDPTAFTVTPEGLGWRGEWAGAEAVQRGRAIFKSIGSCSFAEPVDEMLSQGIVATCV